MPTRQLAAAGLACLAAGCAQATDPAGPATVTIAGCPVAGVEAGCVMLRAADGRLYNITAAEPEPALDDREIQVTAVPSREMDICMQGTKLAEIRWTHTGAMCPR